MEEEEEDDDDNGDDDDGDDDDYKYFCKIQLKKVSKFWKGK